MKSIDTISTLIILTVGYYCILTLPYITYIIFNFGIKYPMWLIIIMGIISAFLANITLNKLEK